MAHFFPNRMAPKLALGFTITVVSSKFATMTSQQSSNVRVASYNVLSDSLCRPSHFIKCKPDDLNDDLRFKRIKLQLKNEIDKGSVLCLQEVSRKWGARLIPFFEENGYGYAAGAYGKKFDGYMGVCVAWPQDKLIAKEVSNERIVGTVEWVEEPDWECPKCQAKCFGSRSCCYKCNTRNPALKQAPTPVATSPIGFFARVVAFLAVITQVVSNKKVVEAKAQPQWDTWQQITRRENCAVFVRFADRETRKEFVVSTYHMPCLFGSDEKCQVMVAHIALLMQAAQRFAGSDPLVVAGDFNMQPDSPPYQVATTGTLETDHPQHPPMPAPISSLTPWSVKAKPMRSAYVVANGNEPPFTNFAWSAFNSDSGFKGTLDYIFLSDHWQVAGVKSLQEMYDTVGEEGFPSLKEPSDHVLIAADLVLEK